MLLYFHSGVNNHDANLTSLVNKTSGIVEVFGHDYVKGTMPVDERTKQPYGILHGGASLGLAETLASTGAGLCIDNSKYKIVGQEINANHLRSATEGLVTGIASPVFVGQRTQVWEVKIYKSETDFNNKNLCCISRMTALRIDRG